jgi:phospholipid transport system substrate-binding protein
MNHRKVFHILVVLVLAFAGQLAAPAYASDEAADALIQRQSNEVLDAIKSDTKIQAGDASRIIALVDAKVMPNVNFKRMTAAAVGPSWRQANPEQQRRLQDEFKTLMIRTYAGALAQAIDLSISVKPLRSSADDQEVVVRTLAKGRGDPIQIDYRLEKTPGDGAGWKIFNLNVMGVWLVETYRSQFAQEISANGIDGLISALSERNKANAKKG